jgi:hypothetical protein
MTTRILGVVAAMAIVWLGVAGGLTAQATRPGDTLQLWEYRTEITRGPASSGEARRSTGSVDASMLNSLGSDGWELVAVTRREIRVEDLLQTEASYTFKRPTRTRNR